MFERGATYSRVENEIVQDLDIQLQGLNITYGRTQPTPQVEQALTPEEQINNLHASLRSADTTYCKTMLVNFLKIYAHNKVHLATLVHYTKGAIHDRFRYKLSDPGDAHKAITNLLNTVEKDRNIKDDSREAIEKLISCWSIRQISTLLNEGVTLIISAHNDLANAITSELDTLVSDSGEDKNSGDNCLPGYKEELERLLKVLAEEKVDLQAFIRIAEGERNVIKNLCEEIDNINNSIYYETIRRVDEAANAPPSSNSQGDPTTQQKRLQICVKIVSDSDRKIIKTLKTRFDNIYKSFRELMEKANHETHHQIYLLLLKHRDVSMSSKRVKLIEGLPQHISPLHSHMVIAEVISYINDTIHDTYDVLDVFIDYLNKTVFARKEVEVEKHTEMMSWMQKFTETREAQLVGFEREIKETDKELESMKRFRKELS